uniref:RNA-directed DNA polymerase, eukaryota n=1 Tax=Tanacetum cinerariifolium TaxID=118510 RepID=A0A699IFY7_TANCI|nr:RNA-directed DNA polymerase, eukaryota [Tanacetum cinerariifolium]
MCSYVSAVNGAHPLVHYGSSISSSSALVLDDDCITQRDFSKCAIGKVKDFNSIPNLRVILGEEGFEYVNVFYLGGKWVMFEFEMGETKVNMMKHIGVNSWFQVIQDVIQDFVSDERVVWVDIEGIPVHAWSRETFTKIEKKWGEALNIEDSCDSFGRKHLCIITKHPVSILESFEVIAKGSAVSFEIEVDGEFNASEVDGVAETIFGDNSASFRKHNDEMAEHHSEDPFELYELLNQKKNEEELRNTSPLLSHPPGFPVGYEAANSRKHVIGEKVINLDKESSVDKNGGSVLGVLEEVIRVGQTMGYSMEGCEKDIASIIGNQGEEEYLSILLSRWNGEVILMGDFNEVRCIEKRRRSYFNSYNARFFDQFISSSGLVDVKMEGYAFTWSHPSANKMSKLDRFLISDDVISLFLSIIAICLDRHLSDHRSILLCEINLDYCPTPFWLYHSWFSFTGFNEMVEQTWRSFSYSDRNGMIRFKKNLQELKKELDQGGIPDSSIHRRHELKSIRRVFDEGMWITDLNLVKKAFLDHYGARFKKPTTAGLKLNFPFPNRMLQVQVEDLERGVSREEIRSAVWDCGENRSLGLDGFTFEFFRKYWEFVELDFCGAIEQFFENGSFSKCCNSSLIALIPKITDAKFVNDYQPISLIGSVYKVVTKIMANWLALVIADIISETQSAFVAERQILDGPFKVEFAKAYDSVREWSNVNLRGIIFILKCFFLTSGLQINISKSQVLGVGVPRSSVEAMAASIGCSIMQNKFHYLGIMVGESMSCHKAWDDVVLKLRSRLSKWKAKTLSIGGRLTLLKSVLGASPLYNISIFKVPKGALKVMESIRNNFFKGADPSKKKITWVAWDKILASKKKGGLGVSSFHALNRPLLLKWEWRFVSQDDSLWSRVIQAVHGSSIDSHSIQPTLICSSILKEVQGDKSFRDMFPRIFALELNHYISVAEKLDASLENSLRRRMRRGLEQQQFSELSSIVEFVSLSSSLDRWVCSMSSDGVFSVKEPGAIVCQLGRIWFEEEFSWSLLPVRCALLEKKMFIPLSFDVLCRG